MRTIRTKCGKEIILDEQIYHMLKMHKWRMGGTPKKTIRTTVTDPITGKRKDWILPRVIMGAKGSGMHVDHINGDIFDNRVSNLRLCTPAQNQYNRGKVAIRKHGIKYKGVVLNQNVKNQKKVTKKWGAIIKKHGKRTFLGYFLTQEEAARAYDQAAIKHFGNFARLNFPDESKIST